MRADNLMPGDLVKSFGNIEEVYMIDASSEDEEKQLINYRNASEFKPIKLTPDILRKNGFKEKIDDGELIFTYTLTAKEVSRLSREDDEEKADYIVNLYVSFDECTESEPKLSLLDICTSFPINYVHDLQHFMKQIKLDKKIINA